MRFLVVVSAVSFIKFSDANPFPPSLPAPQQQPLPYGSDYEGRPVARYVTAIVSVGHVAGSIVSRTLFGTISQSRREESDEPESLNRDAFWPPTTTHRSSSYPESTTKYVKTYDANRRREEDGGSDNRAATYEGADNQNRQQNRNEENSRKPAASPENTNSNRHRAPNDAGTFNANFGERQMVVDFNPIIPPNQKISIEIEYPTMNYEANVAYTTRAPLKKPNRNRFSNKETTANTSESIEPPVKG